MCLFNFTLRTVNDGKGKHMEASLCKLQLHLMCSKTHHHKSKPSRPSEAGFIKSTYPLILTKQHMECWQDTGTTKKYKSKGKNREKSSWCNTWNVGGPTGTAKNMRKGQKGGRGLIPKIICRKLKSHQIEGFEMDSFNKKWWRIHNPLRHRCSK